MRNFEIPLPAKALPRVRRQINACVNDLQRLIRGLAVESGEVAAAGGSKGRVRGVAVTKGVPTFWGVNPNR